MADFYDIHPVDPQERLVNKVVEKLKGGGVIALPTDSGYAIACTMANKEGLDRIRTIRQVDEKHHFTFLCHDFAQLGQLVIVDNRHFRMIKALTPGPYTFILKGTKEVPRMTLNPKKNTVGVRIPKCNIAQAIVAALGEPLLSSTLLLPGDEYPLANGEEVKDRLDNVLDVIVNGPINEGPTSVLNLSTGDVIIERVGSGDLSSFDVR